MNTRIAYLLSAAVIGLALYGSSTPSPLYATYRELWGFSQVVLTLVYAVYAFGVLASLLLAGRVSDIVGRRPVLLGSLGTLMAATVLFAAAQSLAWLFVARAIQGLATGLALGAAAAALLDLHPRRDPAGAGLANGVASASGMSLGVLVSAALIELLPAPRVLPFAVLFVLFALAFAGALLMPEPVAQPDRLRLTPQRPRVPAEVRRPFVAASLGVLSSWSIGGLFLALGPQLSATLFESSNHLVAGIPVFAVGACGALAQLVWGRLAPWIGASFGSVALAAGLALISISASTGSSALLIAGSAIGGAGFGVAFLGALRALSAAIPLDSRAAVMSAFYVVAYLAISVPAVLAGALVGPLGMEHTFELFGAALGAVALAAAFEAWRTRPRAAPEPALALE